MPPRAAIWQAVSSPKQAEKISIEDQRDLNLAHLERHDCILIADLSVSESRDIVLFEEACARIPAYNDLRKLINPDGLPQIDILFCLNRSRLARTLALIETIAELCRRAGILVYETTSPPASLKRNSDSYAELVTNAFRSAGAQHEIDELKRRNQMGMLGKFKRGEFLRAVPWGWKAVFDEKGKMTVEVDPVAKQTIRTALVDLYLDQNMGSDTMIKVLNERGLLSATGKQWTKTSIHYLFRMLWRYAGINEINQYSKDRPYARTDGTWPAIITEQELYDIIWERGSRHGNRGETANVYRFSLMVYCRLCGNRMHMHLGRARRRKKDGPDQSPHTYISAFCLGHQTHEGRYLGIKRILPAVRSVFVALQNEKNWGPYLVAENADLTPIEEESNKLQKEIRKKELAILEADDKLIDKVLDEARHAHQISRLKSQIMQLQANLTALADRRKAYEFAANREARLREIADHGLSYLDMKDERLANGKLKRLIKIWITEDKEVQVEVL